MDRRAAGIAVLLGAPPGIGMGLALLSVTRGEEVLASAIVGLVAAVLLCLGIYLMSTRGSVEDPNAGVDHES